MSNVKANKKNRIRKAMETVLKAFENNPEKVALAVFKGNGKPSDAWSFFNRLIMLMNNTEDARGFRQWQRSAGELRMGERHSTSSLPSESSGENQERRRKDKRIRRSGSC